MPTEYDIFLSYARADNLEGWIRQYLEALRDEYPTKSGPTATCRPLGAF